MLNLVNFNSLVLLLTASLAVFGCDGDPETTTIQLGGQNDAGPQGGAGGQGGAAGQGGALEQHEQPLEVLMGGLSGKIFYKPGQNSKS